jgi:exopolysaccharide production protein ExoZ
MKKEALLPGVHGLRATAMLMVVLFHMHHLNNVRLPPGAAVVANEFGLGVHLFFVISAFSLMYSTKVGQDGEWIRTYFIKRFFRIAPLYYLMFLVYWIKWPVDERTVRNAIVYASFAFNLIPGKEQGLVWASWTIGVEMVFYVVLPLLLATVRSVSGYASVWMIAVVVNYSGRAMLERSAVAIPNYAHMGFVPNIAVFAAGLLAGAVFLSLRKTTVGMDRRASSERRLRWILLSAFIGGAAVLLSPLAAPLMGQGHPYILVWAAAFAALTLREGLFASPLLGSRALVWVGERSYSGYLLHPLLLYFLRPVNGAIQVKLEPFIGTGAFLVCAALTLASVLAAAAVTYRFVEQPGINLGRRLIERSRSRGLSQSVPTSPPPNASVAP